MDFVCLGKTSTEPEQFSSTEITYGKLILFNWERGECLSNDTTREPNEQ